jgi:hypothetical protein
MVKNKEYSRTYRNGSFKFRYNYTRCILELIMITDGEVEVVDSSGLSRDNWEDDPRYWVSQYRDELDEEVRWLMM